MEKVMAVIKAINKIIAPSDKGLLARNMDDATLTIVVVRIIKVIYKYEDWTHSFGFKGQGAPYTILY